MGGRRTNRQRPWYVVDLFTWHWQSISSYS